MTLQSNQINVPSEAIGFGPACRSNRRTNGSLHISAAAVGLLFVGFLTTSIPRAFAEDLGPQENLSEFLGIWGDELIVNLPAIQSRRLHSAALATTPWSGTFWADQKGSIAVPYMEVNFPNLNLNWGLNRQATFELRPELTHDVVEQLSDASVADLSPSEKLDLLIGNRGRNGRIEFTLSRRIVEMVDEMASKNLTAAYTGICHGWAPASLYSTRPQRVFTVRGPTGHNIAFYPADIKAYISFAWAKAEVSNRDVKFTGLVCTSSRTDSADRPIDPACSNVNPGFFHIAAINKLGIKRQGLVMDRNWRREVQNQPFYNYRYYLYSPIDPEKRPGFDVNQLKVAVGSFTDPRAPYRSDRATHIVGVRMAMDYGNEIRPVHRNVEDASHDEHATLEMDYDLELDAQGNIVGGEWRGGSEHPDTIWFIPHNSDGTPYVPLAKMDPLLGSDQWTSWSGAGPIPRNWASLYRQSVLNFEDPPVAQVNRVPQIPYVIIESLLRLSR